MATRMIATALWQDKEFRKIKSIKTRYLWLYLLSCTMSKSCGIFHLPLDMIAFESKLSEEDIEKCLKELELNNFCVYSKDSEEIAIYNYPKYNISNMGKPMIDCITKDLALVDDRTLVDRIILSLKDYLKSLGEEHSKSLVIETMISVYSNFASNVDDKGKTIFKEKNTKTITNTNNNTNTNSDTIHDSSNDSCNDTTNEREKEQIDYSNVNDDEMF